MMPNSDTLCELVALKLTHGAVSAAEFLMTAYQERNPVWIESVAEAIVVRREARRRALSASEDELQAEADTWRERRGLLTVEDFERWLKAVPGFGLEDFEAFIESRVRRRLLRDAIATPERIEQHFAVHASHYAEAAVSWILLEEEGLALELFLLVTEEHEDFYRLAERYSSDQRTRRCGGRRGTVRGAEIGDKLMAMLLEAAPGKVLPPIQQGNDWCVFRLEGVSHPVLDDSTRERIAEDIFREWLREQSTNAHLVRLDMSADAYR